MHWFLKLIRITISQTQPSENHFLEQAARWQGLAATLSDTTVFLGTSDLGYTQWQHFKKIMGI